MSPRPNVVKVGNISIGGGHRLVLIAGPCVIEGREITLSVARELRKLTRRLRIPFVFKSSYKKANRTSGASFTGLGIDEALRILQDVKEEIGVPVLTDIHTEPEALLAAEVADILQIPAFLSRQTDLLVAAGRTGKVVNIKKGQFLAPTDMRHAAEKVRSAGNRRILLTERGTTFGYHNLVVDMRSLVIMRKIGYPVILDATHSLQLPGDGKGMSGGQPEYVLPIARAGTAVGIDGLFIETHPSPARALSDAASQLPLRQLEPLLTQILALDRLVKDRFETT